MRFLLLFACLLAPLAPLFAQDVRPNIVFILSDDHRYDAIGAAGNAAIKTPQLDALAAGGILFTHATVAVPQCSPSRATLLTGLYPHQHGYFSNKHWTRDAEKGFKAATACELLQQRGYRTALIGKWHLEPEPWKCGFSETRLWMPQGSDVYVNPPLARGKSAKVKETRGHVTELFTDDAIDFLRTRGERKAEPFLLWLAYTAPHTPQKPVPEHCRDAYADLPAAHRPPGFPPNEKETGPWAQYYAAITHLDEQLGRVLAQLKESGLSDNTVVMFLGDNGWLMGSHGRHGKIVPEDESTRVPLIVSGPPNIVGWQGRSRALVSSIDLPATWLALSGGKVPATWPGQTLLPQLAAKQAAARDYAVSEFEDEKNWSGQSYRMIRTAEWKYILRPQREEKDARKLDKKYTKMEKEKKSRKMPEFTHEQLFDLKNDPHELSDVAEKHDAQTNLEAMREKLREHLAATDDPALQWLDPDFRMGAARKAESTDDEDATDYD